MGIAKKGPTHLTYRHKRKPGEYHDSILQASIMLKNHFKTAIRHLWKKKLYATINVVGLAVSLTCMVFSILYYKYEHSFDTFHKNNPNLYRINTAYIDSKTGQTEKSGGTGQVQGPAFKSQVSDIIDYVRIWGGDIKENVKFNDKGFSLGTAFVDSNFFKVFSFPLLYGNPNTALNEKHSIVITEKTALKFFGATDVVGKRLEVADNPDSLFASFTITAVTKDIPSNSSIQFDVLLPFSYLKIMFDDHNWLNAYLGTFVVINPKADLSILEQKFTTIHNANATEQLEQSRKAGEFDKQALYSLQSITDIHLHPFYSSSTSREGGSANGSSPAYSYFLLGIALFILLMASINFINLTIGNSFGRAKEIGVRKINGSSKMQIIIQFLIESSVICIAALLIAIVLTQTLMPFFDSLADRQILVSSLLDWKLLLYFLCLLIANILMAGLYPAYVLARFKPTEVLYNKMALSGHNWLGKGLVVLQFSIAVCLIIGSIIYYRQMDFIRTKDLGYNPYNIIRVDIPPRRDTKSIYSMFKNELAKEPAISLMSLEANYSQTPAYINEKAFKVEYKAVEQPYIPLLEISLKEGRNFSDIYRTDQTNAVIVNEAFISITGLKNPIGTSIHFKDWFAKESATIIGVVKNYHFGSLKESIRPLVLAMSDSSEGTMLMKIDKRRQKQALTAIETVYRTVIPGSEYSYAFWDELNARQYLQERKWQQIIHTATILSVLICCLGLFGLTHLSTRKRVKEIGIRKILGASVGSIVSLISIDFIKLVFISVIVASPISWYFMNNWLQDYSYRISISVWIFVLAAACAILIALLSIMYQAINAAMANPVKSLRTE